MRPISFKNHHKIYDLTILGIEVCLDLGDRLISDLKSLGFRQVSLDRVLASYRPF